MTAFAQKSILSFSTVIKMDDYNFNELLKSYAPEGTGTSNKELRKPAHGAHLSKDELDKMMQKIAHEKEELAMERKKLKYERAVQPGPQWLIGEQVMKMLSISKRTLQTYRDTGILGSSCFGGKFYYHQTEIEELLEKHYVKKGVVLAEM
jgi:hypothetical protein